MARTHAALGDSPISRPGRWGELDYLVVDLPPGTGDVAISLIQTVPLTGAMVVTTPSDVSLQDARKAIEMFRTMKVEVIGVIENMSSFHCPHCHKEIDIFSKGGGERTAKQFDLPFLGRIESTRASAKAATADIRWCSKASSPSTPARCLPLPRASSGASMS